MLEEVELFCGRDPKKADEKAVGRSSQISEVAPQSLPFHIILQSLHKLDVLTKEAILTWYDRVTKTTAAEADGSSVDLEAEGQDEILDIIGEEKRAKNVEAMAKFVEYLKTAKDESASSSSDSDESEGPSQPVDYEMLYQDDLRNGAESKETGLLPRKRGRKKQAERLIDRTKVRFDP